MGTGRNWAVVGYKEQTMRLIDAEYCEDFFDRWESRVKNAEPVTIDVVQNTRTLLREAPSIDIVRCGECKYYLPMQKNSPPYVRCRCYCNKGAIKATSPDDFCSYGERKEQ